MNEQDYATVEAMIRWGGSFVKHLGEAAKFADSVNLEKIKITFPEYWKKYSQMAASEARDQE